MRQSGWCAQTDAAGEVTCCLTKDADGHSMFGTLYSVDSVARSKSPLVRFPVQLDRDIDCLRGARDSGHGSGTVPVHFGSSSLADCSGRFIVDACAVEKVQTIREASRSIPMQATPSSTPARSIWRFVVLYSSGDCSLVSVAKSPEYVNLDDQGNTTAETSGAEASGHVAIEPEVWVFRLPRIGNSTNDVALSGRDISELDDSWICVAACYFGVGRDTRLSVVASSIDGRIVCLTCAMPVGEEDSASFSKGQANLVWQTVLTIPSLVNVCSLVMTAGLVGSTEGSSRVGDVQYAGSSRDQVPFSSDRVPFSSDQVPFAAEQAPQSEPYCIPRFVAVAQTDRGVGERRFVASAGSRGNTRAQGSDSQDASGSNSGDSSWQWVMAAYHGPICVSTVPLGFASVDVPVHARLLRPSLAPDPGSKWIEAIAVVSTRQAVIVEAVSCSVIAQGELPDPTQTTPSMSYENCVNFLRGRYDAKNVFTKKTTVGSDRDGDSARPNYHSSGRGSDGSDMSDVSDDVSERAGTVSGARGPSGRAAAQPGSSSPSASSSFSGPSSCLVVAPSSERGSLASAPSGSRAQGRGSGLGPSAQATLADFAYAKSIADTIRNMGWRKKKGKRHSASDLGGASMSDGLITDIVDASDCSDCSSGITEMGASDANCLYGLIEDPKLLRGAKIVQAVLTDSGTLWALDTAGRVVCMHVAQGLTVPSWQEVARSDFVPLATLTTQTQGGFDGARPSFLAPLFEPHCVLPGLVDIGSKLGQIALVNEYGQMAVVANQMPSQDPNRMAEHNQRDANPTLPNAHNSTLSSDSNPGPTGLLKDMTLVSSDSQSRFGNWFAGLMVPNLPVPYSLVQDASGSHLVFLGEGYTDARVVSDCSVRLGLLGSTPLLAHRVKSDHSIEVLIHQDCNFQREPQRDEQVCECIVSCIELQAGPDSQPKLIPKSDTKCRVDSKGCKTGSLLELSPCVRIFEVIGVNEFLLCSDGGVWLNGVEFGRVTLPAGSTIFRAVSLIKDHSSVLLVLEPNNDLHLVSLADLGNPMYLEFESPHISIDESISCVDAVLLTQGELHVALGVLGQSGGNVLLCKFDLQSIGGASGFNLAGKTRTGSNFSKVSTLISHTTVTVVGNVVPYSLSLAAFAEGSTAPSMKRHVLGCCGTLDGSVLVFDKAGQVRKYFLGSQLVSQSWICRDQGLVLCTSGGEGLVVDLSSIQRHHNPDESSPKSRSETTPKSRSDSTTKQHPESHSHETLRVKFGEQVVAAHALSSSHLTGMGLARFAVIHGNGPDHSLSIVDVKVGGIRTAREPGQLLPLSSFSHPLGFFAKQLVMDRKVSVQDDENHPTTKLGTRALSGAGNSLSLEDENSFRAFLVARLSTEAFVSWCIVSVSVDMNRLGCLSFGASDALALESILPMMSSEDIFWLGRWQDVLVAVITTDDLELTRIGIFSSSSSTDQLSTEQDSGNSSASSEDGSGRLRPISVSHLSGISGSVSGLSVTPDDRYLTLVTTDFLVCVFGLTQSKSLEKLASINIKDGACVSHWMPRPRPGSISVLCPVANTLVIVGAASTALFCFKISEVPKTNIGTASATGAESRDPTLGSARDASPSATTQSSPTEGGSRRNLEIVSIGTLHPGGVGAGSTLRNFHSGTTTTSDGFIMALDTNSSRFIVSDARRLSGMDASGDIHLPLVAELVTHDSLIGGCVARGDAKYQRLLVCSAAGRIRLVSL